ncbi:MAG: oxygen-dependent coproporphyrinogen oxidase [Saprospiraceae bacterium]|nr:oxygen-dependent coproporphyrinogen oxidase [Saprospiraceae bacterium]
MITLHEIQTHFKALQSSICEGLELLDGVGEFQSDPWQMASGGGGISRVIHGVHIEKGGVNFSAVSGPVSEKLKKLLQKEGDTFFATGVSIVLHPVNPLMPVIHMNVRYFEMADAWWFGGGIDLTPHYIDPEQARDFHRSLKAACDQSDPSYYAEFKQWADDYFFVRHRDETRGIGGIFFDRLDATRGKSKDELFQFVLNVGQSFLPIYQKLWHQNVHRSYTEQEKRWQMLRRGRYAEFNLVWDRGTRFGLETGGRTESILMSLPPSCHWMYNYTPEPDSREQMTLQLLKKGIDWINWSGGQ